MMVTAVVNVRMGSERLPGKVLRPICGRPLLSLLLARLGRARRIGEIVVATSQLTANDAIADFCARERVVCFRGPEQDVLGRTLGALRSVGAEVGVVVFGDGPFIDPAIVDSVVEAYLQAVPDVDFVGNDLATTYPPGMEAEAFSVAALADADRHCHDAAIREHGTLYVRCHPERYRLVSLEAPGQLRRPELELEVDSEVDLQLAAQIQGHFGARLDFTLAEIIDFLDARPDIARLNSHVARRWRVHRKGGRRQKTGNDQ